jgi:hypothetical protein
MLLALRPLRVDIVKKTWQNVSVPIALPILGPSSTK